MKKPRYPYRIALLMLILTVPPIGATQLGWYLYDKQKIIEAIDPSKDVDGFHPMNVGNLSSGYESSVPCTPCLLYTSPSPRDDL